MINNDKSRYSPDMYGKTPLSMAAEAGNIELSKHKIFGRPSRLPLDNFPEEQWEGNSVLLAAILGRNRGNFCVPQILFDLFFVEIIRELSSSVLYYVRVPSDSRQVNKEHS